MKELSKLWNQQDKVWLSITKNDIDKGEPGNCNFCPVSIALKRITGKEWFVFNDYCFYIDSETNEEIKFDIPLKGVEFIRKVDISLIGRGINEDEMLNIQPISFFIERKGCHDQNKIKEEVQTNGKYHSR